MISAVSLVIPCHNPSYNLEKLTNNIQLWSQLPQEILLIDSSLEPVTFTQDFTNFCNINDVVLKIFHAKNLYPGKARNLGIKNNKEWKKYCKSGDKPDDIPANPWNTYKEWKKK